MFDLEEEWEELMDDLSNKIIDKRNAGDLTEGEAYELLQKVKAAGILGNGATPTEEAGQFGTCPQGHGPDCGWSPSMGYHCF